MKPMLAVDVTDFTTIKYPVIGSPKIDGVRALMLDRFMPRSLKHFPNIATNRHFNKYKDALVNFDGELVVGPLNAPDMCRRTTSALTSIEGDPEAVWHIFDQVNLGYSFKDRAKLVEQRFKVLGVRRQKEMRIELVPQILISNAQEATDFEKQCLDQGYEGVVFKSVNGMYKFGRSTAKEQGFMRTKRFEDAEGEVVGYNELMRNNNEAKVNELGNKVRSSHKANKSGGAMLGNLEVRVLTGPLKGQIFELGTGFDEAMRKRLWAIRDDVVGKTVKFRYFSHGVKDKPRWPSFVGFRGWFDM